MDDVLEDALLPNNTDELYNFAFNPTAWDIVQNTTGIAFTMVGLISDIIIIYMIGSNGRMQGKTNVLLMNFIINDACFLIFNVHFLSSVLELSGSKLHYSYHTYCVVEYLDAGFQLNESIFLLILVSNTLIKSKRIQIKWLLIVVYMLIAVNFAINQVLCHYRILRIFAALGAIIILVNFTVVLCKEINNCYKKWHKKDPLSGRTLFRLYLGRIYVLSWIATLLLYLFKGLAGYADPVFFIFAHCSYMSGLYILLYIVYADKNFKICFLNLLRCKRAGDNDIDATMTLAEDFSGVIQDNTQVNININSMENRDKS